MGEIIVALIGLAGVALTYYLKQPTTEQKKNETVNTTIQNLRDDLRSARQDAKDARSAAKDAVDRVEMLENRDRRRFQYELRHRAWDESMIRALRQLAPEMDIPDPPPFSYFDVPEFEVQQLESRKDDDV